ncbi:MAG: hypothetical protein PVG67_18475 [Desulfobacterales bacterium]
MKGLGPPLLVAADFLHTYDSVIPIVPLVVERFAGAIIRLVHIMYAIINLDRQRCSA